jgi:ABC-type methionine transport system ATPase subunit
MMTNKKKTATPTKFEMNFPAKMIEEPIMHKLSTDHGVVPNILRGRITAHSAKLEVELSGKAKDVEKALAYLKTKGVTIRKLKE